VPSPAWTKRPILSRSAPLARAALAVDEHRERRVGHAGDGLEDLLHGAAPPHDPGVAVPVPSPRVAADANLLLEAVHVAGALLEELLHAAPLLFELPSPPVELLEEPGVRQGDAHLVRQGEEHLEVLLLEEPLLEPVVDVECAERTVGPADGHGEHRLQLHGLYRSARGEAAVGEGLGREHGLARFEDLLRDAPADLHRGPADVLPVHVSRHGHAQAPPLRPRRWGEDQEAPLRPGELDCGVHGLVEHRLGVE